MWALVAQKPFPYISSADFSVFIYATVCWDSNFDLVTMWNVAGTANKATKTHRNVTVTSITQCCSSLLLSGGLGTEIGAPQFLQTYYILDVISRTRGVWFIGFPVAKHFLSRFWNEMQGAPRDLESCSLRLFTTRCLFIWKALCHVPMCTSSYQTRKALGTKGFLQFIDIDCSAKHNRMSTEQRQTSPKQSCGRDCRTQIWRWSESPLGTDIFNSPLFSALAPAQENWFNNIRGNANRIE